MSPVDVPPPAPKATAPQPYVPLLDTLRLYAGWLLAWYAVVYLVGSFQWRSQLPFEVPFIDGLFLSPIVLRFAFGTYLFLLLSTLHRALGSRIWLGALLTVVGVGVFLGFSANA